MPSRHQHTMASSTTGQVPDAVPSVPVSTRGASGVSAEVRRCGRRRWQAWCWACCPPWTRCPSSCPWTPSSPRRPQPRSHPRPRPGLALPHLMMQCPSSRRTTCRCSRRRSSRRRRRRRSSSSSITPTAKSRAGPPPLDSSFRRTQQRGGIRRSTVAMRPQRRS